MNFSLKITGQSDIRFLKSLATTIIFQKKELSPSDFGGVSFGCFVVTWENPESILSSVIAVLWTAKMHFFISVYWTAETVSPPSDGWHFLHHHWNVKPAWLYCMLYLSLSSKTFYYFYTSFIYYLFMEPYELILSIGTHFCILVNTSCM